MFYSQFILSKKGPLGTIWIAAHLEGKLRKNQINETDIPASVDCILFPEVPIALRLSGHLLLGVVRIYSRKVNYLFHDCSEALIKIKQAFHASSVDLPPEAAMAPFHSVTLPETFDFDELEPVYSHQKFQAMADVDEHMTARDLITLKDNTEDRGYFGATFTFDERLPGHGDPYSVLDFDDEDVSFGQKQLQVEETVHTNSEENNLEPILEEDVLPPLNMDENIERLDAVSRDVDMMDVDEPVVNRALSPINHTVLDEIPTTNDLMTQQEERSALSIDEEASKEPLTDVPEVEKLRSTVDVLPRDDDPFLVGLGDDLDLDKQAAEETPRNLSKEEGLAQIPEETVLVPEATPAMSGPSSFAVPTPDNPLDDNDVLTSILGGVRTPALKFNGTLSETPRSVLPKRGRGKRKFTFDHETTLSSSFMKKQLSNTDDLCHARKRASRHNYEAWRLHIDTNTQPVFSGPSVPGISLELKVLYERIYTEKTDLPITEPKEATLENATNMERTPLNHTEAFEEVVGISDAKGDEEIADISNAQDNEQVVDISNARGGNEEATAAFVDDHLGATRAVLESVDPVDNISTPFTQNSGDLLPDPVVDSSADVVAIPEPLEINVFAGEDNDNNRIEQDLGLHGENEAIDGSHEIHSALPTQSVTEILEPTLEVLEVDPNLQGNGSARNMVADKETVVIQDEEPLENLEFLDDTNDAGNVEYGAMESEISHRRKKPHGSKDSEWSVRTRAVAQYLQASFVKLESDRKQETRASAKLSLGRLVRGRPRKEAARLFFETLVLKSKGYLDVEQGYGLTDIYLLPTPTLMKGDL